MGQFRDIVDEVKISSKKGDIDSLQVEKLLKGMFFPELEHNAYYGIHSPNISEKARTMYDMVQVLRKKFTEYSPGKYWGVWADQPTRTSEDEKMMEVKILE